MMIKSGKSSLMKAAILVLVIVFLILGSANSVLAAKGCSVDCEGTCDGWYIYFSGCSGGSCASCYSCYDCYTEGYCGGACGTCAGSCTTDVECGGSTPTCENPPAGQTTGCTCVPEFSPSLGLVALFSAVSISTLIYKYKKKS